MARRVFVSFRFSDGFKYKEDLCSLFKENDDVIDCSENKDRSSLSDDSIKKYLYAKLRNSSVTIVILTPDALEYEKDIWSGKIDDWMYDELRYSLEDRENNRTNGVIAVYTKEAMPKLITKTTHICNVCNEESVVNELLQCNNLCRKNMLNVKEQYKKNACKGIFDSLEDSYISLVSFEDFSSNINKYIENAVSKRERIQEFNISVRM
jgi:hypothetical protein